MRKEIALKSDDITVELRGFSLIVVSVQNKDFTFVENVTLGNYVIEQTRLSVAFYTP
jgi:hypothetical protein